MAKLTEKVKKLVEKIVSQNGNSDPLGLEHLHNFLKNGKTKKGEGGKEKMEVNPVRNSGETLSPIKQNGIISNGVN